MEQLIAKLRGGVDKQDVSLRYQKTNGDEADAGCTVESEDQPPDHDVAEEPRRRRSKVNVLFLYMAQGGVIKKAKM